MIDNWNTENGSGYHTNIMEGPHGGGGTPWADLSWGDRVFHIIVYLVFCLIIGGAITLAILLSGCGDSSSPPQTNPATLPSPPAAGTVWSMNYGQPPGAVVMQPGDYFDFPICAPVALNVIPCSVNYVESPWGSVAGRTSITLTYEITGESPVFSCRTNMNNMDPCEGAVSLILHRAGDDLSANMPYHRWFSDASKQRLAVGRVTYTVPLTMDAWVPVQGPKQQAGFDAALANIATIGFGLGGGFFAAHGVGLTSGSARMKDISIAVN